MKLFRKLTLLLLPALVVSLNGCGKKKQEEKTTIAINPVEIEMYEEDYALLNAETNSTKSITYTSDNNDVVSVNSSGVLLAKNAGATYVKASVEDVFASCYVLVKPISEKIEDYISFDKSLFVIGLNDEPSEQKVVPTYYHNKEAIGGKIFTYSSSNQSVIDVSGDGVIEVKGTGTALINVACDALSAYVVVDVYDIVIRTTKDWVNMLKMTQKNNARFCLANDLDFTGIEYVYYSSFIDKLDPLMGLLEGNYHTVSNITMKESDVVQSIFGCASAFILTNIRFINIKFTSTSRNGGLFTDLLQHYSVKGLDEPVVSQSIIKNVLCDFIFSDVYSCVIADRFYGANVDNVYAKVRSVEGIDLKETKTSLLSYLYYTWYGTSHFINVIGLVENGVITKDLKKNNDAYYPNTITEVKTNVGSSLIEANYLASLSFDSNIWNIKPNEFPSFINN